MDRLKIKSAVYLILINQEGKVLFSRRKNTGWEDGKLSLPSGHIDQGEIPSEAAIRELKEELDISINIDNLSMQHCIYRRDSYIDFYFHVQNWDGEIQNMEENICSELIWINLENTNDIFAHNVLESVKFAVKGKVYFAEYDE